MLFVDGYVAALAFIFLVLVVSTILALLRSDRTIGKPAEPVFLLDEQRAALEGIELEIKRRALIARRQRRKNGQIAGAKD